VRELTGKLTLRAAVGVLFMAGVALVGYLLMQKVSAEPAQRQAPVGALLRGRDAYGDTMADRPGLRRLITAADLPSPRETQSSANVPRLVRRPENAWPQAPAGFTVQLYASGFNMPRKMITAPNGDVFLAESNAGKVRVLRGLKPDGASAQIETFASNLNRPFGLAFYPNGANPQYLYVGNTDSVVRFSYRNGDLQARGMPEKIVPEIPAGGGHWTRDVVFLPDGSKMLVAVGSASNAADGPAENRRAKILEFTPDGKNERVYASGIRNPVGLAVNPQTGEVWTSVNERDGLGDDLVPDYVTHVTPGGFYGWPWYYIGQHPDPTMGGRGADMRDKVLVPDVLLQAHSASLGMTFYTGTQFPAEYRGDAFAGEHGSWNRARRTGYKVIRVPAPGGKPTGEYEDFVTGFVTLTGDVWGRPVGVVTASDGALLISDDGSNSIWRVAYQGTARTSATGIN
jgi:glucose/arabinose dehydrogenase